MDLKQFLEAASNGVPLLFVVFGVVQVLKMLKAKDGSQLVHGNTLLLLSLLIGLILGIGWIMLTKPPEGDWHTKYVYWFGAVIYGLGLGILAAVFYDALKQIVEKSIPKLVELGILKVK